MSASSRVSVAGSIVLATGTMPWCAVTFLSLKVGLLSFGSALAQAGAAAGKFLATAASTAGASACWDSGR